MRLNEFGQYYPHLLDGHKDDENGVDLGEVCPFYVAVPAEQRLGMKLFSLSNGYYHPDVGFYQAVFAGHVTDTTERYQSSSGGVLTWLLVRLLEQRLVDGVLHVTPVSSEGGVLFAYGLSLDASEIRRARKSRYYPVQFSDVIAAIRKRPGRYAVVGVPCFITALRLLTETDPELEAALHYFISIFCGHLKSTAYAEAIGWSLGIEPSRLDYIDFRVKEGSKVANRYGVKVVSKPGYNEDRQVVYARNGEFLGADWGIGLFKPKACDFCDDITGELADISFGDAWLPEYVRDPGGTNVIVVRNELLVQILVDGLESGELKLTPLSADDVRKSQAGNFRHRHDGLAYRLWLYDRAGKWRPKKRVEPRVDHLPCRRKWIYRLRMRISQESHKAFRMAKKLRWFGVFLLRVSPLIWVYYLIDGRLHRMLARLVIQKIRNLWRKSVTNR